MSVAYRAVGWSPQKVKYDLAVAAFAGVYLAAFAGASLALQPQVSAETLVLRASGSLAFVMLTGALAAGPLARLSPRFLPVLRNRRHLGVATFLAASAHGALALFQFHFLGVLDPLASLLSGGGGPAGLDGDAPFQLLGALALAVLFVMAATSHDFWLATLTPATWKSLHMLVYAAYAALVGHVALGALRKKEEATSGQLPPAPAPPSSPCSLPPACANDGETGRSFGEPAILRHRASCEPCALATCRRTAPRWWRWAGSGSRSSVTGAWCRACPTSADTRWDPSARAGSWTAASPAPGTASSTIRSRVARRPPSRTVWKRTTW